MSRGFGTEAEGDRANLLGAYIAIAGIVIFNVAVFLDWAKPDGEDEGFSGYETDSVLPFAAYVGLGFAVALLYAAARAYHRQHRGLSLASMAFGIGVAILALAYGLDVPGNAERTADLESDIGAWIGLLGAAMWALGSGMLAQQPEGDRWDTSVDVDDSVRQRRTGPGNY